MKVLYICVSLVAAIKAGYHEEVGIPLAARIEEYEKKVFAEVPDMQSRIVGGEVAPPFAHPYLAGLLISVYRPKHMSVCGSSLVTATRLLTAGHCVERAGSLEAVLASQYLYYGGTRITSNQFEAHPLYNFQSPMNEYDIAVVYLPQPVTFSAIIQPISLPASQDDTEMVGEWAIAAGYGFTNDNKTYVPDDSQIREVRLRILPEMACTNIPNMFVCTDGWGGVGVCQGDSGGPLIVNRYGRKVLVGITSYTFHWCTAGRPSGFIRVASFLEFIHQRI